MDIKSFSRNVKRLKGIFFLSLFFPSLSHASFIESTIGAAVVNDATATLFNPSALVLLKDTQVVGLGSIATFQTKFTGQSIQSSTGFTQTGGSSAQTHYFLPSFYLGIPTAHQITMGIGVISNYFNRDIDNNAILRYVQSGNNVQDIDFVPAIGVKLNDQFSIGVGLNFSYAKFVLEPISGFPSLNIPDNLSRNESDGTGVGGDIGILYKSSKATLMGFNYRSSITYKLTGKSVFESQPNVVSTHYAFHFWTPARSVFSINHFVTSKLGFIGTLQRIDWSIFQTLHIHNIATRVGTQAMIVNANVPYHLHDSWLLTLGTHYRLTPKWVVRVAGTFNQSPSNPNYQISLGDSFVLGASMGYEIYKNILIDASYAHAFIRSQDVNIVSGRNLIEGVNRGWRDAISLKLTVNL